MLLRQITLDDSDFLYDLYMKRDPIDIITSINYNKQENFVKNYLDNSDITPFQSWNIIEIDGKKIGAVTLNKKNNEIGYWILPEFQNKGFGTEAIQQFMDKNKKSYYTIRTHIDNKRSQHMAEKLKFKLSRYEYYLDT